LTYPHHAWIEPFAGSLAVLLAKPPVAVELVNDLDDHVVRFYRVLREQPDALHHALSTSPYARAEFESAVDAPDLGDVERVRRWFLRATQTHVGSAANHSQGRWTATIRGSARASGAMKAATYADRVPSVAERLRRCQFTQEDGLDLLAERVLPRADHLTVIYVDPPYLSGVRPRSVRYATDSPTAGWHGDLVGLLAAYEGDAQIIVSGYDSDVYGRFDEAGWNRVAVDVIASGTPGRSVRRTEVLWTNRTPPETPFLSSGQYCSEECARAASRAQAAERRTPAACAHCGTQFQAARSDAVFCSGACRQAAYRQRLRQRPRTHKGHPTN
jgi:DNA adenine methylase